MTTVVPIDSPLQLQRCFLFLRFRSLELCAMKLCCWYAVTALADEGGKRA